MGKRKKTLIILKFVFLLLLCSCCQAQNKTYNITWSVEYCKTQKELRMCFDTNQCIYVSGGPVQKDYNQCYEQPLFDIKAYPRNDTYFKNKTSKTSKYCLCYRQPFYFRNQSSGKLYCVAPDDKIKTGVNWENQYYGKQLCDLVPDEPDDNPDRSVENNSDLYSILGGTIGGIIIVLVIIWIVRNRKKKKNLLIESN